MLENVVSINVEENYETYCKMAEGHKFPPIPLKVIDEILAYVEGDEILYTCFVWNAGSKMTLIGFPVSNLDVDYSRRKGKLDVFIEGIVKYCKDKGTVIIWTTSGTERIMDSLDLNGFSLGDEGVNLYLNLVN